MAQRRQRQKSEYGLQLAEKKKIRDEYGLREKQFRAYFKKGKDSGVIFQLLESRLDNAVFRAGLTITRPAARQMVSHGHILVNNRKVTIPSYHLRQGDTFSVREQSRARGTYEDYDLRMKKFEAPGWMTLDKRKMESKIVENPNLKEEPQPFNFQSVIEFYNR